MWNSAEVLFPAEGPGRRPALSPSERRSVTARDTLVPTRDFLPEVQRTWRRVSHSMTLVLEVTSLHHQNQIEIARPWKTWPTIFSSSEIRISPGTDIPKGALCWPASVAQSLGRWLQKPRSVLWGSCPCVCVVPRDCRLHVPFYRYFWLFLCANLVIFSPILPPSLLPFLHSFSSPLHFSLCFFLRSNPSPHGTHKFCRGREKANAEVNIFFPRPECNLNKWI